MSDFHEVKRLIEEQGRDWQEAKTATDMRFKDIEEHILSQNRPSLGGATTAFAGADGFTTYSRTATTAKHEKFYDAKTKKSVAVLSHGQSLAALESKNYSGTPSVGRLLRGIVLGGRADDANELADERKSLGINSDPSGGYWRAIKVTELGWEVMSKPPVFFRRYSHQKPLPNPAKGGRLSASRHAVLARDNCIAGA